MYIIIIGAGKLGYQLSEMFSLKENNVALVDINDEALLRANSNIDLLTVNSSGLDLKVLEELNAHLADIVIAVTSNDETNMLIATLVKKLGCKKVIARIRNPEHAYQLDFLKEHLAIDYVSNPELEVAKEIGKNILKSEAINMEDFAKGRVGMFEVKLTSSSEWINHPIKDVELPKRSLIVAVLRDGKMSVPNGFTVLEDQDTIYMIGVKEELQNYSKKNLEPIQKRKIKRAMILGGGKAAFYLAKMLLQSGVLVKIIERDKDRCKYLAQNLEHALIIHGDATDVGLLVEEDLSDMDALILLTGFDEENILLSMVAKKHGVHKIITKVSKPNYVNIIEQLGIEMAINPILISASGIMRNAQGGRLLSISMLLGGHAEVMEIIAHDDSRIVETPLHKLNLPEGLIIGAVVRGGKVYIPDGNFVIHAGNRVVVFCLKEDANKIEPLFYKTKRGILNELWRSNKSNR